MISISESSLAARIRDVVEQSPRRISTLTGGMISQVMRVDLADGSVIVAKTGEDSHDLTIEAYMLAALRERSRLPVPSVIHAEPDLLLLEHIAGGHERNQASERHLGELLAQCHLLRGPRYGLERDTLIGPLHQPNPPSESWISFFREHRLLYMTGLARASGYLPPGLDARLLTLADSLDQLLIEPEAPALIHGDIWRSNIIAQGDRIAGIIDPALYYAHNEMELAYMRLFDGFGDELFSVYHAVIPLDPAFTETRQHVYSLYPLLVHLIIFGEKYIGPLEQSLAKVGF